MLVCERSEKKQGMDFYHVHLFEGFMALEQR